MKNAAPRSPATPPSRDQVIETVIDIFVRVIGFIDRNEVSRTTHVVRDFFIDTDDLSLFALEVDKHFGIRTPSSEDWPGAEPTIEAIANHVLAHLRSWHSPIPAEPKQVGTRILGKLITLFAPGLVR